MFTDNDELSGLIASMMDAQALIILSNIDGIYNGSPADPASEVIREIGQGKRPFFIHSDLQVQLRPWRNAN